MFLPSFYQVEKATLKHQSLGNRRSEMSPKNRQARSESRPASAELDSVECGFFLDYFWIIQKKSKINPNKIQRTTSMT